MRVVWLLAFGLPAWAGSFQITSLSARPDMVTGGDVMLRVTVPEEFAGRPLESFAVVKRNGAEVTSAFRSGTTPDTFEGVIAGLQLGSNLVEIFRPDEEIPSASLKIRNHPVTGPVFSGPHERPYVCETSSFLLPDGSVLGEPVDRQCSSRTVVTYLYRSTSEAVPILKPLPSRSELPADVAQTTTSTGESVPYVVRVETGTINRAIYQIAMLHDPTSQPEPNAFTPNRAWNRRLLYSFGGGCTEGWYHQGTTTALGINSAARGSLADSVLSAGYAYASATLNVFGINCQDVTAAETMMMVKEHFIETYGKPLFTFGRGGSGGAYQQIQIADNYPGLLDGIIPSATFPDVLATIQYLTDAQLLHRYFTRIGYRLSPEQKKAIAGVGELNSVTRVSGGADRINPRVFCPPVLPASMRYHPETNRTGARCDVFDHTINVYGRDPATGFARRPVDNTGVQYGLLALNTGLITPDQFLDLNENVGGYDNDANFIRQRTVADPLALRAAYSTGRVTYGGNGLASVPIIDLRGYLDLSPKGDLHLRYHSVSFRNRLLRANGNVSNLVMVTSRTGHPRLEEEMINAMDEWLTRLSDDTTQDRTVDKIARAKPADLVDACYSPTGDRIAESQTSSTGECNKHYPIFPSPRTIAGGPATNDVLKCTLKPIDLRDYRVALTSEQKRRLRAVFPDGVCDWGKPGIAQTKSSVWQNFARTANR